MSKKIVYILLYLLITCFFEVSGNSVHAAQEKKTKNKSSTQKLSKEEKERLKAERRARNKEKKKKEKIKQVKDAKYAAKSIDKIQPVEFETLTLPLERAIRDLRNTYGEKYPQSKEFFKRLTALKNSGKSLITEKSTSQDKGKKWNTIRQKFKILQHESLLANPLIDFKEILLIRRNADKLGLPANWQGNSSLKATGYDNDIAILEIKNPKAGLKTLFRPLEDQFVGDMDLHFNARKILFSMPYGKKRWQVYEMNLADKNARLLPLIIQPDVDNYDACYLPDGNIIFSSTAPFIGVPCVKGSSHVANLYLFERALKRIRRLTFDQDHNWCPTVLNNGRMMYLRWEYSDIPHFVSRILFHMNPDGFNQSEYYGSNSYWPNSIFYARPIPGHPTMVAGIVTGHHGVKRMGELVLFDPAKGRFEADGAVQRIPGYGKKVEPILLDRLVDNSWPKFLHPYPLNSKYFLVSAKMDPDSLWSIYLVDIFDNMLLLREQDGYALLEPIPLKPTTKLPVIPSRIDETRKDALVFIADIYNGPGLKDVPQGTVKKLRLLTYHFAYHGMGGQINRVGMDGPWDIKRVLGTVPVDQDGSAFFRVPANTPISFQPLDEEGKAIQLMRSWTTAMPGESVSCIGCHESQSTEPPAKVSTASRRHPSEITPWYGPVRGFSFVREVQPVLDKYCAGCHNGQKKHDDRPIPDFTARPAVHPESSKENYSKGTKFTPSYSVLRHYVRTPTIESDMHINPPYEWHVDTTKLFQMLNKGHYNVQLDVEAKDKLITWVDLNAPAHGTWADIVGNDKVDNQRDRRRAMMELYAGINEDPEEKIEPKKQVFIMPDKGKNRGARAYSIKIKGWPFEAEQAVKKQHTVLKKLSPEMKKNVSVSPETDQPVTRLFDLGKDITLEMVLIPTGEFIMGDEQGYPDEQPLCKGKVEEPFWMARFEIKNEQYKIYDKVHDSRIEHGDFLQFSDKARGDKLNLAAQPVVRVSWNDAMAFCKWLSEKTGMHFTLPTEAQWEWACRAGASTPMWYGSVNDDFTGYANLADSSLKRHHVLGFGLPAGALHEWKPSIVGITDGARVSAETEFTRKNYKPNPWGLYNMHGNVAEWTLSEYRAYPYDWKGNRNEQSRGVKRVARGGSWYERPKCATACFRQAYQEYQKVFNVGFRVICMK